MNEIWKTVYGFDDYLVSNLGRVKTKSRKLRYTHAVTGDEHFRVSSERFLKIYSNDLTGYKFVQLYLNKKSYNKTIHRLVAENFLIPTMGADTVNHIDGNKHNNIVDNLEWCTNAYNHEHATKTGLKAKGGEIGTSKLNDKCIVAINKLIKLGWKQADIAELFEVSRPTITLINTGVTWKHTTTP